MDDHKENCAQNLILAKKNANLCLFCVVLMESDFNLKGQNENFDYAKCVLFLDFFVEKQIIADFRAQKDISASVRKSIFSLKNLFFQSDVHYVKKLI